MKEIESRWEVVDFERRRHPRFLVTLPIEYWQNDESKSRVGRTIDISEGGLLLHLSEPMEIGQTLELTLFMTSGPDLDSVEALVRVEGVWRDSSLGEEGGYRIGVKFVDIPPEDMHKLKTFLTILQFRIPSELEFHPQPSPSKN
jgi:c-di-GMP-binding flagellar brake protein YcgR